MSFFDFSAYLLDKRFNFYFMGICYSLKTNRKKDIMKTRVHLNLHKSQPDAVVYSVRRGSNPVDHVNAITLQDVAWHVGASGLANVRRRGVRQVFAWAKGDEVETQATPIDAERIAFNPFKEGQFVWASDRTPCGTLATVYFTTSGAYAER